MDENYDDCHHRKTTRTFIFTKCKKSCETFLFTKSQTLFKKLDSFRYAFKYKKRYIDVTEFFYEIFEVSIYIQKA